VLFHTKGGMLTANKVSGYQEFEEAPEGAPSSDPPATRKPSSKGVIELDFPLIAATECNDASLLSEALGGVEVKWIGRSNLGDYLVRVQEPYISLLMCNHAFVSVLHGIFFCFLFPLSERRRRAFSNFYFLCFMSELYCLLLATKLNLANDLAVSFAGGGGVEGGCGETKPEIRKHDGPPWSGWCNGYSACSC
jgi:hypothetical protein